MSSIKSSLKAAALVVALSPAITFAALPTDIIPGEGAIKITAVRDAGGSVNARLEQASIPGEGFGEARTPNSTRSVLAAPVGRSRAATVPDGGSAGTSQRDIYVGG